MNIFVLILAGYIGLSFIGAVCAYCLCVAAHNGDRLCLQDEVNHAPSGPFYRLRPETVVVRKQQERAIIRRL